MALEIKATLRVYSKNHSLKDLVGILGGSTNGFSIGDKFSKGRQIREHTYWSFNTSHINPNNILEDHLKVILKFFDSKKLQLQSLREAECEMDIFCMLYTEVGQGSAVLTSEIMDKISKHGLRLILDFYADCGI